MSGRVKTLKARVKRTYWKYVEMVEGEGQAEKNLPLLFALSDSSLTARRDCLKWKETDRFRGVAEWNCAFFGSARVPWCGEGPAEKVQRSSAQCRCDPSHGHKHALEASPEGNRDLERLSAHSSWRDISGVTAESEERTAIRKGSWTEEDAVACAGEGRRAGYVIWWTDLANKQNCAFPWAKYLWNIHIRSPCISCE